jgi:glycerol-3-phosphate dehydrogenase
VYRRLNILTSIELKLYIIQTILFLFTMSNDLYDVIIIGGGVVGCATARELSRFRLRTALLEKSIDLAAGASRANTGLVHAGFNPMPGTLKAKLNVEGHGFYEEMVKELNVPYRRNGALVVATDEGEITQLEELKDRGEKNGVGQLELVQGRDLRSLAPVLTEEAVAALHAPAAGIVSPYELVFALAENAHANGVDFYRDAVVTGIDSNEDQFKISTSNGEYRTRVMINAAGLYSDTIARMVGDTSFEIQPRRGEYLLLDRKSGIELEKTLFPLPTEMGKGIVVTPTVPGNILVGPNAEDIAERYDSDTTEEGLAAVFSSATRLVPTMSKRHIITYFAGIRAISSTDDFVIGPSTNPCVINAAGIQSPGLTAAPAIAKLMVEYTCSALGLEELPINDGFNPTRAGHTPFSDMDPRSRVNLISTNTAHANVVCRCEHVTEAEVLSAIRTEPGARTVDGIKLRTRAGMGRCQGGYCSDRVMKLLSSELNLPLESITKHEPGSWILAGRSKVRGEEESSP